MIQHIMMSFYELTNDERAKELMREAGPFAHIFDEFAAASADKDGKIIRVTAKWCELLERTPGELYKMRFMDFTHPDDAAYVHKKLVWMWGHLSPIAMHKRMVTGTGKEFWCHAIVFPMSDEKADSICGCVMVRADGGEPPACVG